LEFIFVYLRTGGSIGVYFRLPEDLEQVVDNALDWLLSEDPAWETRASERPLLWGETFQLVVDRWSG